MTAAVAVALLVPSVAPSAGGRTAAAVSWTAAQLGVPADAFTDGAGYAGPISCPAVGGCVVLGEYSSASGLEEDFIATQKAGVWSAVRAPLPTGGTQAANLGPYTLACTGVGDCVGASLYQSTTSVAADVLEERGGVWSAVAMPLPANASPSRFPTVAAMTCPRLGDCVIAGTYTTTSGLSEGLVVTEEGKVFVAAEAPTPSASNEGSALFGVACTAAAACAAVGDYVAPSGRRQALIVNDVAGALTAVRPPLPPGAAPNPHAELQTVACGSATGCVALGTYLVANGDSLGVIDTSSSGTWSAGTTPTPTGASSDPSPAVFAVTCKGATFCLGVGQYTDSTGRTQGLVLIDQSGAWSASIMPATDNRHVVVRAVACASVTSCAAAGHYVLDGEQVGYLMTLSGSTLSASTSSLPANASSSPAEDLGFVSCRYIATCTVSGNYNGAGSTTVELPLTVSETP